jgi:hypothetical protein
MASDTCKNFLSQLESWTAAERPADPQSHLKGCSTCRSLVEDLRAIRAEANAWGGEELEPPEHIWTSLRAQLLQEGLIRSGKPERGRAAAASSHSGWFSGLFDTIPRPALAGAYLSVLVALGFALSGPINKQSNEARWLEGTNIATSPLSAQLNSFEQNSVASNRDFNPAVTASLHQNLAIVDNYISLCEKSVQEEPQNEVARDYLYEAYQQKADLLAQISERGENVQ